jgi:hypothetical protein
MKRVIRRSPLASAFAAAGFALDERYGMQLAAAVPISGKGPWLADVSALSRCLLVGDAAAAALARAGLPVPAPLQRAYAGHLEIIRIARRQFLLIGAVPAMLTADDAVLRIDHEAAEFVLWHAHDPCALFADLCDVDLARFGANDYIPLRLAAIDVALRRDGRHGWRLQCSPAEGPYLFSIINDVVIEAGGCLAGFDEALARDREQPTDNGDSV